jgi:L-ribulose-5-phosphate 3-epimerase
MSSSRRSFLAGLGALTAAVSVTGPKLSARTRMVSPLNSVATAISTTCPFQLAVINDEISQDFGHACEMASKVMGLRAIELRGMWKKNIAELDSSEIAEARKILAKYQLQVTDIASPLFKVDWPGAPIAKDRQQQKQFKADSGGFNANFDFKQQDQLLERCIELADIFKTGRIRCFDFLRLDDQRPYRKDIDSKLQMAAIRCAKSNKILLLENEESCNTRTAEESAAVLHAIPNRNFMLNWDPANAAAVGSTPYPNGYDLLPKDRIGHCHCKDVVRKPDGTYSWAPVGGGVVDWVGQFRALRRDGYSHAVSLETHWHGPGTPEANTHMSMQGLTATLQKAGIVC